MPCSLRGRPPWTPSRSDTGSSRSRETSGPSHGSLVKRDVHSPVASLSSFVDYRETMGWLQEKITDLACFKLAPVTTMYAVPHPIPPHPHTTTPLHFLALLWGALTLNVPQVCSFQSLEGSFQPLCTWPEAPYFSEF